MLHDGLTVLHDGLTVLHDDLTVLHNGLALLYDDLAVLHNDLAVLHDDLTVLHNGLALLVIKNSADLIDRLINIDFTDKQLISFNIVSLYTNVNIEGAIREAVQQIDSDKLPFKNNREYYQHEGLPMGSPSGAVLASLYMEILEKEHINHTISIGSKWFLYVENRFMTYRENSTTLTTKYNSPTHDDRTKSRVVIQFYLRAFRICSEEYLTEELNYITAAFKNLKYPGGMLRSSLRKATNIKNREANTEKPDLPFIVVPESGYSRTLSTILRPSGLVVVNDTGKKVGHLVRKNTKPHSDKSIVYKIACNGCDSAYFGEKYRGVTNRLKKHKADIRHNCKTNALVNHGDTEGHLPDWEKSTILAQGLNKKQRKITEFLHIVNYNNTNKTKVGKNHSQLCP
ncbi:uncharacterized protein LOC143027410 [Oratosquilla oratoria]|uniref:uncharacterized protein LOC143027410 n=1 Tax=Oratosquilla oratoria TaxID=337810 RepID=UPI003F76F107